MNPTQIQSTLAPIVALIASLLAGHIFDSGTWTSIIMWFVSGGAVLWGAIATRKTALISTTANLADVKSVTLTATADPALVNATPNNVTK